MKRSRSKGSSNRYLPIAPPLQARHGSPWPRPAPPLAGGPARVGDSAFLPFLRDMASGGMVPPWPQWWPDDVMSGLFPDEVTRRSVAREAHAMPLAFFEEVLPQIPGSWRSCHPAYLRFSEGYQ